MHKWFVRVTPGPIAGAATRGLMWLKKPMHGSPAWDCLRRDNPSYRAIFANETDRAMQPGIDHINR